MSADSRKQKSKPASQRSRTATAAAAPDSAGDITFISVPRPPASAMNRDRPISELIKAQLHHIQHAESARLPPAKRIKINHGEIRNEAEAASYIAAVTAVLHPQGRTRKRARRKLQS